MSMCCQEHHFAFFPIKNCCGDGFYSAVFCREFIKRVSSNHGVSCTIYKSFQSLRECQQANESNDLIVKKRLEKNFIYKMMGGRTKCRNNYGKCKTYFQNRQSNFIRRYSRKSCFIIFTGFSPYKRVE